MQIKKKHLIADDNTDKFCLDIFIKKTPKFFLQIGSCVEYGFNESPQNESSS